ncbi:hypothetical protein LTH96_10770 [Nesterenkonia sp. LB17]|uniref:sunset domain-containing protein n=1 Tax=Nesterenkonia sp. LB17 TaxID=2901230 RepID=UPI001F4D188E|nr:hypothetical protein [Nesterenkonia sp. LB17]MCH8566193.1 hypothetical protein [Nesterenkonia sp. LB17]
MGTSQHWRTITTVLTTTVLAATLIGASAPPPATTTQLTHSVLSASAPAAVQVTGAPASSMISAAFSAAPAVAPAVAPTTSRPAAKTLRAPTPAISGAAAVGKKLITRPGAWTSGTSLSYRWHAEGRAISGATRSTFTPSAAQQGKRITVQVTGKLSGYATASKTSAATLKVARSSAPRVTGSAVTGKTVSASVGTWTPSTSFSYQWRADGTSIKGATSRTYTVANAHQGKKLSVRVTGKKSGHTTLTRTSASTAAVKKATSVQITSSTFHCPKGYPVKGNADSGIYHVPSGAYYTRTKPEECFATEAAARSAGYRKSKR